ncbi:MAG TPA: YciI family protein [Streptosporangiaceae bacterium]|nr:YciI family protein [Streptosporangiaceae bacterium]
MRYVLFYNSAEADPELTQAHFPAHRARWAKFAEDGRLLLIGPFSDRTGAMAVFTTREAAEEFAASDPFVVHGVISDWTVREWMEALSGS